MNKQKLLVLVLAFIGGSAVMAMEVIFPRISVIWFGNVLHVWSAMLIGALLSLSLGYWLGSRILRKGTHSHWVLTLCYALAALVFITLPKWDPVFTALLSLDAGIGSLLCALLVMLPSVGALAVTSPILVHRIRSKETGSGNASLVFTVSTFAGVAIILIGGAYLLMEFGIAYLSTLTAVLLGANIALSFMLGKDVDASSEPKA